MNARTTSNKPGRGPALRSALCAAALVLLTSACSSVPDAVNPVAWVDAVTGDDNRAAETQAPPGADEQFPGLGRVDEQAAERENLSGGLSADTAGRQYADSIQRQQEEPQNTLYAEDKPPAAAAPEVPAAAPAPAPAPSSAAAAPAPAPAPVPSTSVASASTVPAANDSAYAVDGDMRNRLAQQLAEIQARAADRGSLLPPNLSLSGGSPTVIVSSDGVQTVAGPQAGLQTLPGVGGSPALSNQGALPLPSSATRVATILFGNGSSALDTRDREILSAVARLQKQNNGTLRVIGHASQRTKNMDASRHRSTNLKMSVNRAESVASALRNLGVAADNILVAAVGDTEPVYREVMPSGEAGNRRTEIYLSN